MDAVGLDGAGDVDQVFVDHGHKGRWCLAARSAEDLLELLDVILAVVGRKSDAGEQDLDVRVFEGGQHLVEVAAGLVRGKAAEAVVAAEFDDYDCRVQQQDGAEIGDGVFGGGSAGALIADLVVVAAAVEVALQSVGIGLAGLEAVAGGDAVAKADQDGAIGSQRAGPANISRQIETMRAAANVHRSSVAKSREQRD